MEMKHSLITLSLLFLTACGGGSNDDETPVTEPPVLVQPTPPAATISGKVIDGYVTGATVFLDLNGNSTLDENEPSAISGDNGEYSLDLNAEQYDCQSYVPLVVDVPVGATDSDTGEVTEAYQLVFPPMVGNALDSTDITPLTTVIWESLKSEYVLDNENLDDPDLTCDAIRDNFDRIEELAEQIEQTLADIVVYYNISQETIFDDYIANGDNETYELALLIVKGLKKGLSEETELKIAHPNSSVDVKYLKTEDGWVRKEYIFTPSTDDTTTGWSLKTSVESSTTSMSDDLETVGPQIDYYNRTGSIKYIGNDKVEIANSEEICNKNEYLNYFESKEGNAIHEREITNITSTCENQSNQKYLFNMDWTDHDKRLGDVGQYILRYDTEENQFMLLNDARDFYENKDQLDFTAINAEIDNLSYRYDDDISDTSTLFEMFTFVILTKNVEEEGLRVEYSKTMYGNNGWNYETKRFNEDGTYTKECKAWDADEWGDCE
jgi:hypothetical protein